MYVDKMVLGDILFSLGVQRFKTVNKNNTFVVGLTSDNETKINGEYTSFIYNNYLSIWDTTDYYEDKRPFLSCNQAYKQCNEASGKEK